MNLILPLITSIFGQTQSKLPNIYVETCCVDYSGAFGECISNNMKSVSYTWDPFVWLETHFKAIP